MSWPNSSPANYILPMWKFPWICTQLSCPLVFSSCMELPGRGGACHVPPQAWLPFSGEWNEHCAQHLQSGWVLWRQGCYRSVSQDQYRGLIIEGNSLKRLKAPVEGYTVVSQEGQEDSDLIFLLPTRAGIAGTHWSGFGVDWLWFCLPSGKALNPAYAATVKKYFSSFCTSGYWSVWIRKAKQKEVIQNLYIYRVVSFSSASRFMCTLLFAQLCWEQLFSTDH